MNSGRLCQVQGNDPALDTHQRASDELRAIVERYHGLGFSAQQEWIGEMMIQALLNLARRYNVMNRCEDIELFLTWAAEEIPGVKGQQNKEAA